MSQENTRVVVVDFNMGFGSLVKFMVKCVLAAIPAYLILIAIAGVFYALFAGVVGALLG